MAPEPHRLDDRRLVGEREHGGLAPRDDAGGLRRPVDEGRAVDRKRRRAAAADRKIAAPRGFEGDFRRQPRIGGEARRLGARVHRLALGRDRDERAVGLARVAAQVEADAGARFARHVEHQFEPGAGAHRKLVGERFERLARLAVDGDDEDFRALIATVARRAVAALPRRRRTRAPGRALSFNGAAAPLAKTTPPLRPLPRPMAGSAKSSLIWPLASTFQSDSDHRRVEIDVRRLRLVDDDRPEQPASLLAGVGRAGVGQIQIEAGIWGNEADFGARAGFEPILGEAADAGAAFAARKPGKLSVVGSASLLANFSFSSSPCLSLMSGPGIAPA